MTAYRPFSTVLVANRGEIARRVMRTARKLGYGTVAVYSDPDSDAVHVREADLAVPLGGDRSDQSYLVVSKIIDAARRSGADGIHPGYGFLSESPALAQACDEAGLVWIGPPAAAMEAMALKVPAKALAASLGVPLLPGATLVGDDTGEWLAAAATVGFPLLVKASAGGGGKGMRTVLAADDLVASVEAARREALASFGDATVFLERLLTHPRHVEVQVFADSHGNAVHLLERDCSVQRRHQKVIEESPSPAVDDALRVELTDAALRLTREIGYVGAGTVELLVQDGEFFFLEMNTRLQVEHPVTEALTGLDLVRLQFEVASGAALPFTQGDVVGHGHAIEARLYAEDVPAGFLPSPGHLNRFEVPAGVRVDSAVENGSDVSTFYDPMVAKVIAHAPTRAEAARRLAKALRGMKTHGLVTNRSMLIATLEHADFAGDGLEVSTAFLDQHPEVLAAAPTVDQVKQAAIAAVLATAAAARIGSPQPAGVPAGWRNTVGAWRTATFTADGTEVVVATKRDPAGLSVTVDGVPMDVTVAGIAAATGHTSIELVVGGVRGSFEVASYPTRNGRAIHVNDALGQVDLVELAGEAAAGTSGTAGPPDAPMPGTIVAVSVVAGQQVVAGDLLVVLEAMKMEHRITAAADATVGSVLVGVGDPVDAHQVLLTWADPVATP